MSTAAPADVSRAMLNILDDLTGERTRMRHAQLAVLNVLDDAMADRGRFVATQTAMLNVLGDFGEEKERMQRTQRAALNLLEDFDDERNQRQRAEAQVRGFNADLETRIGQRTVELSSANQEIEAFVYATSHELRTPLRAIDGFAHVLLDDFGERLGTDGRDSLRRVREAAQRMGEMIDRMQRLARIGTCALRRESVNLGALAVAVVVELRAAAPDREVEVAIEDGLRAAGDPELLAIVVRNLLENAWKFTSPHPRGCIHVGGTVDGGELAFHVSDDGVGFDMAFSANLFAPFERLHGLGEFAGAGMGLSIVRRIVQRHGGRVWAEGEIEKGATFHFTLPAVPAGSTHTRSEP